MKKIIIVTLVFSLFMGVGFLSASANDNSISSAQISACMQAATAKKNASIRAADDSFKTAKMNAKRNGQKAGIFSKMHRQLQRARKSAKEAAKVVFQRDRLACRNSGSIVERKLTVPLSAQNNSGVSGMATLKEEGNNIKVVIETIGGTAAATPQPAHIHVGACPTPGAIKYPLTSVVNGRSETTIENKTLDQLRAELPLAINVHKSESEMNVYIACGDVRF